MDLVSLPNLTCGILLARYSDYTTLFQLYFIENYASRQNTKERLDNPEGVIQSLRLGSVFTVPKLFTEDFYLSVYLPRKASRTNSSKVRMGIKSSQSSLVCWVLRHT